MDKPTTDFDGIVEFSYELGDTSVSLALSSGTFQNLPEACRNRVQAFMSLSGMPCWRLCCRASEQAEGARSFRDELRTRLKEIAGVYQNAADLIEHDVVLNSVVEGGGQQDNEQ